MLPRHARCVLSRVRYNGHSVLFRSYQFRICRIENPSRSACGHSSQDTSHLILHCPAADSLRRSLFGGSLSLYNLFSRPWELSGFWGSMVFRHASIPRKRSGKQQQQNEITDALLRNKGSKQIQTFLKLQTGIASQSAACYHKIPLLPIYIHETPLHIRNSTNTYNKRRPLADPIAEPLKLTEHNYMFCKTPVEEH